MTSFANALFSALLSWVRAFAAWLWGAFSGDEGNLLTWLGEHWKPLVLILCAAGMAIDLAVYLVRWRPYRVWASFFRRLRSRRGAQTPEVSASRHEREPSLPLPKPAARSRRAARHAQPGFTRRIQSLLQPEESEETRFRLKHIEPLARQDEAYSDPYIPPQWKDPAAEPGVRHRRAGRNRHV